MNNKEYYQKNKEKIILRAKEYYLKNKEKVLSNVKEYSSKPEIIKKARVYKKTYKKKNPQVERKRRLKVRYGLTPQEYNDLFIAQKGQCKICEIHQSSLPKRLAVDHCHTTLVVRGLLCDRCNLAIGHLKDSIVLVQKTLDYLKETQDDRLIKI